MHGVKKCYCSCLMQRVLPENQRDIANIYLGETWIKNKQTELRADM